ncbi:hypothetical protein [Mycobacterium kiyosense]|uniref:hypothetical protein n=1 Tax=Mycobacterium kiyosense TaxID=2871094 RepID=UPI0022304A4C|nr:hypothetical protein [Mycobacterium kiyosense]
MADPVSGLSIAALVVSICSATVALLGFLANLALYKLSGARLKVQLVFCYAGYDSLIQDRCDGLIQDHLLSDRCVVTV